MCTDGSAINLHAKYLLDFFDFSSRKFGFFEFLLYRVRIPLHIRGVVVYDTVGVFFGTIAAMQTSIRDVRGGVARSIRLFDRENKAFS